MPIEKSSQRLVSLAGGTRISQPVINLLEGTNVTITVVDDPTNGEVDVTINSSGGGGGAPSGPAGGVLGGTYPNPGFAVDMATQAELDSHKSRHVVGGGDAFVAGDLLDATAKVTVRKNTGADVASRRRLNFIETSSVLASITDDSGNEEIDIALAALIEVFDAGVSKGSRNRLNFLDNGPIAFTVADDVGNSRIDVQPAAQWASTVSGLGNSNSAGVETDLFAHRDHVHKRDVRVAKAGSDVGTRNRLNFIEGGNVTLTVTDDGGADEVDITIAAASGAVGDQPYSPGSYTIATENFRIFSNHLKLTSTQRVTLQGTSRLRGT